MAGCAAPTSLQVIDNVLRHEAAPPPAPALVHELLSQPLAAQDAAALFGRSIPQALARLAEPVAPAAGPRLELHQVLEPYLLELAAAHRALQAAVPPLGVLAALLPAPGMQRDIAAQVDAKALAQATGLFLDANARLARTLRESRGRIALPEEGARIESGFGVIVLGTSGNDLHELAPVRDGRVFVLIDPGGDDRYAGSDIVLHGLAAILDLGGNDRYESEGPGWGAAVAGVSLLLDVAGDDHYASGVFGQGAALAGLGALIDLGGNDSYRLRAFGQGLGLAGGTGLLWDRGGNDGYHASGLPDPYDRGGGLSFAQGAAVGVRTAMGGGVGILRDDAGDDTYDAQMFAQGAGYYYGLGLLWEGAGNDQFRAVRYAQGAGVHQAVGVLRDESGDDEYALAVGVGQGMGLDLAVGALVDAAGDDRYAAPTLAQGAATANGVGIIADRSGRNTWQLEQPPGWGRAQWARGLPSVGLVLADAPRVEAPVEHETESDAACTPGSSPLQEDVVAALREVPHDDFDRLYPMASAVRCALAGASDTQAKAMWEGFERLANSPYAGLIAGALRVRPAPAGQMRRLVGQLAAHASCGVRTAALSLDGSAAAAQAALRSSCWRLQARALLILRERGVTPASLDGVPDFLRQASSSAPRSASSVRSTER